MVLDLAQRLRARGRVVHILTRGYGGRAGRDGIPVLVNDALHTSRDVGDEALLLARVAPCWVGRDRVAAARNAIADGADCLLMDDGFQNAGLHKDISLLLIDGMTGFGNGCVLPAGPLREKPESGLAAADMVVVTGAVRVNVAGLLAGRLRPGVPVLHADLVMDSGVDTLRGKRVFAFAGLARPQKFFQALSVSGVTPVHCEPFPDHHMFRRAELERLEQMAAGMTAELVTTPKDAARLPADFRRKVRVAGVHVNWSDPEMPDRILDVMCNLKAGGQE
ncbi:tetraacyldisaccharide 4'-kinase [Acetobacter oeni]|uniref:Tetraacyldisaccharide 4'-kinase n=2 Tax=Acetobacter oeni TaxID=304077 RepID=A0A511XL33_9PROT|nr:tetraacyldisaccharide 4'-kinase [Acetobacter oeni]GEN63649.1 tetraacyldisaccharide 4'-kinase [Acetobacter oeni]